MSLSCISCQRSHIKEVVNENKRYFFCDDCNKLYERAHDTTYGRDKVVQTEEGNLHLVASAVLRNKDGEMLLIKRRSYPFGYTFPGGHIEYSEQPLHALRREIIEELGLHILKAKLIFKGKIDITKCRYGADSHLWHLYECIGEEKPLILNPESETADWYSHKEALNLDLTPSARYILSGIVTK